MKSDFLFTAVTSVTAVAVNRKNWVKSSVPEILEVSGITEDHIE
jgi:hypothetical protein